MPAGGLFGIINRYFWAALIVVTCVNAAVWWRRAQPVLEQQPERREGFRRLIRGWLIYGNIPWIVMGFGIVFGGVPSVFHYFNPKGGPFVIAWYVTIVLLWLLIGAWLFFMRGAEQLIEYSAPLNLRTQNPFMIKLFFLLGVGAGAVTLTMMLLGYVTVP
jgi:hypothetical protein